MRITRNNKTDITDIARKMHICEAGHFLERHCKRCNIPVISVHGLRHTHASLLMSDGTSIASVSMRLGHSSMNTTQKVYLHVIKELENKDTDIIMRSIAGI